MAEIFEDTSDKDTDRTIDSCSFRREQVNNMYLLGDVQGHTNHEVPRPKNQG